MNLTIDISETDLDKLKEMIKKSAAYGQPIMIQQDDTSIFESWVPCSDFLPITDNDGYSGKLLVSFLNWPGVEMCEYRNIDKKGKWYYPNSDDSPEDIGLIVTAWMPLPKRYEPEQKIEM